MSIKPSPSCNKKPKMSTNSQEITLDTSQYESIPDTPQSKRLRVGPGSIDTMVGDQRRGRIELDKGQRNEVLRWILACHINLTYLFTETKESFVYQDIHVSEQITSIFSTTHATFRQESLNTGNLRQVMQGKTHTISYNGRTSNEKTHDEVAKIVRTIATNFGFEYKKPERTETNHWYGTASSLLSFIIMFKVRINELRTGHGSFTVQKTGDTYKTVSTSYYGFYSVHHPLLEGITIPPEKKGGMAQSLGPLTSLVCLARAENDQKYSKRWKAAVKRNLSFLPEIDSIIEACCGKSAQEVKGLYNIIGDIVLITTSREAKRASFPACMMYLLLEDAEKAHYVENMTRSTVPTDISSFNFSGIGAANLYKKAAQNTWTFPIQSGEQFLPEIIFHAIWGSYGTDFGILEYMTNHTGWATRNKMGDCFKKMGTSASKPFRMLGLEKFSKLSSANQTGLLSLAANPLVGKSAFSGQHKQIFTDEFLEYLDSAKSLSGGVTKNIETLKNILMQTKEALRVQIGANRTQIRRTTKWFSMHDAKDGQYGSELLDIPMVKNQLFMQGNN